MPSKCCIQYVSKSGRPSSGHRTGKGQSSYQFSKQVVPKNVLTIGQLHSSPMLVRSCLKSCMLGFSIMVNQELPDVQAGFRKGRGTRDQIANIRWIIEKQGNFRKSSISVSSTMIKPLTVWIMTNCEKLLERWGYQTTSPVSWETCMQVKKQQLEPCMEQLIGSRLRKEWQGCLLSPCLLKLYAEHIMRNAGLDELPAGI